ncbi:sugar phosphate nucleotidyltransferase [Neobacillus massiliamazoniensis]|uniref:sugar phosphate nucleotidyltransferase n=1 Tax=Neobacillus massiliamazoniensis TaxID=1499688 RepID=UPI000B854A13|nr:sugar phosphate nucleotidyltransferase [Neobacillus massiliamazoniensis]
MKVILLSGGSGLRLWPLSNTTRSKQYLNLLKSPIQGYESMIQRVWRQLSEVDLQKHTYLAANKVQSESILNQLGEGIRLIIEPERRDTFPAVSLAAAYLHSVEKVEQNEVITVLPVDHLVGNHFFHVLKELEKTIQHSNADILLLGFPPTEPSEKYGYIIPEELENCSFQKVKFFVEKPDKNTAEKLIENNALWNCGVFVFKLKYLLDLLETKGYSTEFDKLANQYDQLPNISFDFEVVEKCNNIIVKPFKGHWKDLGTWNDLTQVMETNVKGSGIISGDSTNVYLINELNIPVVMNGVSNVVLAASHDGILISHMEKSSAIKPLVQKVQVRTMVEEKRWGTYRVLDIETLPNGNKVLTKSILINAGENISYQAHVKRSEVWTITSGMGLFVLDDRMRKVTAGDVLVIPVGAKHTIKSLTELQLIEVQMGSDLLEEDIIRICMTWEEVERICLKNNQRNGGNNHNEENESSEQKRTS